MANLSGSAVEAVKCDGVQQGDAEMKPLSTLDKQIIRQIEYYFGDVNLARDKFLQEQVKLDEGWIPLDIMLKFKRLAQLSTDPETILTSLAKSPQQLMEVSEDRLKIRRSPSKPLPILNEERRKELVSRTVYAKGFPTTGVTLDMLLDFFKPHGPVENLQMRTLRDKATNNVVFKGSVYVMFSTLEGAQTFMALDSVNYEETELIRKWQSEHFEQKKKDREERRSKGKVEQKSEVKKEEKKEKTGILSRDFIKGCLLHLTGFSGEITREDIKSEFAASSADVAFVHFSKGDSEGWVRLEKENAAKEFLEKRGDGKMEVCGSELEVRMLEGEEEEAFLNKSMDELKQKRSRQGNRGRGRGGRGGRGHRGGGRGQHLKRRGSPIRGGDAKKQAT